MTRTVLAEGDAVEIYDTFSGVDTVICTGNVERITKMFIFVRNQHGNLGKFRVKDNKTVGYHWPQVTNMLRKVGTTGNNSVDLWNAQVATRRVELIDKILKHLDLDRAKLEAYGKECGNVELENMLVSLDRTEMIRMRFGFDRQHD